MTLVGSNLGKRVGSLYSLKKFHSWIPSETGNFRRPDPYLGSEENHRLKHAFFGWKDVSSQFVCGLFARFVFFFRGQSCKPHSCVFVEKPSIWIASNDTNVIAFVSGVRTLPNPKTFHRDGLNNDMHVDRVKTIIVRSRRFLDKKKESTTVVHQGKNKETVGESSFIVKNAYRGYLYCPFYNESSTCASNE